LGNRTAIPDPSETVDRDPFAARLVPEGDRKGASQLRPQSCRSAATIALSLSTAFGELLKCAIRFQVMLHSVT